jgi:hypothetical protein
MDKLVDSVQVQHLAASAAVQGLLVASEAALQAAVYSGSRIKRNPRVSAVVLQVDYSAQNQQPVAFSAAQRHPRPRVAAFSARVEVLALVVVALVLAATLPVAEQRVDCSAPRRINQLSAVLGADLALALALLRAEDLVAEPRHRLAVACLEVAILAPRALVARSSLPRLDSTSVKVNNPSSSQGRLVDFSVVVASVRPISRSLVVSLAPPPRPQEVGSLAVPSLNRAVVCSAAPLPSNSRRADFLARSLLVAAYLVALLRATLAASSAPPDNNRRARATSSGRAAHNRLVASLARSQQQQAVLEAVFSVPHNKLLSLQLAAHSLAARNSLLNNLVAASLVARRCHNNNPNNLAL